MTKSIHAAEIYTCAKERITLGIRHNRFYIKNDQQWFAISSADLAIRIRSLYSDDVQKNISSGTIKEVLERFLQTPDLQLHFLDDTCSDFINMRNGVFNVTTGDIDTVPGDFSYSLDFSYINKSQRQTPTFDAFVRSVFPDETNIKAQLLLEILGYALSEYTKAKAAFFFIGESNSGKSTLLELLQRVFPEHMVATIPLHRLSNRFNLARLADCRININTELDEKSLSATDVFKQLTAGEVVTAEHKGCKPFDFRIRCKSINAGNILPELKNDGGMPAMLNRMIILLFPVSIPKEKQNLQLLDELWNERDAMFSNALDALVDLKKRNFRFTEPNDSLRLKKQLLSNGSALEDFLNQRCIFLPDAKEHLVTLYESFIEYCNENLLDMHYTKTAFSQNLSRHRRLQHAKFRLNGSAPLAGIKGIRLKTFSEYRAQDSEVYSDTHNANNNNRNTGTPERKEDVK